jgi:uncharacterized OsmC-like protein
MRIRAKVSNTPDRHHVDVTTGSATQALSIGARADGGSAVSGGEFLMLALATCYCNDVYREAKRLGVEVTGVEVEASATFPGIGLAATDVAYRVRVDSPAAADVVADLVRQTDAVAEIHNTLRAGAAVQLVP